MSAETAPAAWVAGKLTLGLGSRGNVELTLDTGDLAERDGECVAALLRGIADYVDRRPAAPFLASECAAVLTTRQLIDALRARLPWAATAEEAAALDTIERGLTDEQLGAVGWDR